MKLSDVLDAIEKNGYEQIPYMYISYADGKSSGCAIGQAALNLGRFRKDGSPSEAQYFLAHFLYSALQALGIADTITYYNDEMGMTLPEIAAKIRREYSDLLDTNMAIPKRLLG